MEKATRRPCPSDVSDEEWAFVAPYLVLLPEDCGQRRHAFSEVVSAVRWLGRAAEPTATVLDARSLRSSCESGPRSGARGEAGSGETARS